MRAFVVFISICVSLWANKFCLDEMSYQNKSLDESYKITQSYDKRDRILEILYFDADDRLIQKNITKFDKDEVTRIEDIKYILENGKLKEISRAVQDKNFHNYITNEHKYTVKSSKHIETVTYFESKNKRWQKAMLTKKIKDDEGRDTFAISYVFDKKWIPKNKSFYHYNNSGYVGHEHYIYNEAWRIDNKYEVYDNEEIFTAYRNGEISSAITQIWGKNGWENTNKNVVDFSTDLGLISEELYVWSEDKWELKFSLKNSYDEAKRLIKKEEIQGDNSAVTTYIYDENGNNTIRDINLKDGENSVVKRVENNFDTAIKSSEILDRGFISEWGFSDTHAITSSKLFKLSKSGYELDEIRLWSYSKCE